VSPGVAPSFTNTGCTITGSTPPATNAAAASARVAFLSAYAALQSRACTNSLLPTIPASTTLFPGVYCTDTALTATGVTLTLDAQGDSNAVWIFKIGAALTGTNFTVVMANGAKPCNVFWVPADATTMTTSALKGNIVAGSATLGSITLTGGSLAGRALANVAVTMTGTGASVIGCSALADSSGSGGSSCKGDDDDDRDGHDQGHGKKDGGRDDDRDDDRGHGAKPFERK
jgi:hypothetical protein